MREENASKDAAGASTPATSRTVPDMAGAATEVAVQPWPGPQLQPHSHGSRCEAVESWVPV